MKTSFENCRLARRPGRGHVLCVALLCATTVFAVGCNRKNQSSEPPAATPPPQAEASQAAPATPPAAVNSAPMAANTNNAMPDLRPLNQALLRWIVQNRRRPSSFEDFAASANTQIPPPPPGKKYILNSRGLISLANLGSN
jgi:hypothetical protein